MGVKKKPKASFSRRTITLPAELEAAIDTRAGRGKFSAFTQQALIHELQRESIASWLDEREAQRRGKPLDPEAVRFAEDAWRNRK
jgi:post-segregation antitoxin (ccd killing protein)